MVLISNKFVFYFRLLTIPSLSMVARICSDPGVTVNIDLQKNPKNFNRVTVYYGLNPLYSYVSLGLIFDLPAMEVQFVLFLFEMDSLDEVYTSTFPLSVIIFSNLCHIFMINHHMKWLTVMPSC